MATRHITILLLLLLLITTSTRGQQSSPSPPSLAPSSSCTTPPCEAAGSDAENPITRRPPHPSKDTPLAVLRREYASAHMKPVAQKRDSVPPSSQNATDFNYLKIKLNQERAKGFMVPDVGGAVTYARPSTYGGVNTEPAGVDSVAGNGSGKRTDTLKTLYAINNAEKKATYFDDETGCSFERECKWTWLTNQSSSFAVKSEMGGNLLGPRSDASNNKKGHFLLLRQSPTTQELHVTSPIFEPSEDTCRIQLSIYQESMQKGNIRIVLHNINKTQVVVDQIHGDDSRTWINHDKTIGKVSQKFRIILEAVPAPIYSKGSLVAFDNIKLYKCYPEPDKVGLCSNTEYVCATTQKCINSSGVCDIVKDCTNGDDERQNCDKLPFGARCSFDENWCGWEDDESKPLRWMRHNGTSNTLLNGSKFEQDHTYPNSTGKYMHVMVSMTKNSEFASVGTLKSVIFNPPPTVHGNVSSPYYNSCQIRFYFHQDGSMKSGLMLLVTELRPKENSSTSLSWSFSTYKEPWIRQVVTLPNITYRYYLHFDLRRGIRYNSDVAIDDISLSPQCFGLNIPTSALNGYNYWNPLFQHAANAEQIEDFQNETLYEFTSCGVKGRYGPYQENCTDAYQDTKLTVDVLKEPGLSGVQKWRVPASGYYTIFAFGASGGKGSGGMGSTRGAMTRAVFELKKSEDIYILVGQEGSNACLKSLDNKVNTTCQSVMHTNHGNVTEIRDILSMKILDGGGGGGGATFVFTRNRKSGPQAMLVASGGGGLGLGRFIDTGLQHGQGVKSNKVKRSTYPFRNYQSQSGGPGGSWQQSTAQTNVPPERSGQSFFSGSVGGKACYLSEDGRGDGGFGGGGGGCTGGGGGGGYHGGHTGSTNTSNMDGTGGTSFISEVRTLPILSEAIAGYHTGSGMVIIVPEISGCGCDYRCLAIDAQRSEAVCICPDNWILDPNGRTCNVPDEVISNYPAWLVGLLSILLILVTIALASFCFMLYNRYQIKAAGVLRRKMLTGPDLQLNRLRVASDSMMTEYNPNYEFGGVVYTLKDLKDIPRDQLRLVKALGQGAFGEVYQGFYRQRSGDTVEMPVAVKTLPEMSTNQAEMDFLMEALIMSKFNHPNIVHFIGVCFDKHPRFIVLELLAGGDLKNFLRESRPKPERGSPLTMKDLILISVDVAKGCKYLENNRFIHRDIAARNCLLTTKGPGRCVKIADFGMSRDIYRSDYYRKGGKAMLPIKWMPPEAFLDGIFTSKTDVWSFGVLLWEIMSMGYMPYTGCANREVMQLVTSGGRLEPPANCPGPIYGIMTQCWHPAPEQRPTFALILERLGYCSQDPQVMSSPLPVFNRPPSHERDATVMRPNNSDDNCLQVPNSADYLIPNHTIPNGTTNANTVGSTSSVDQLLPENSDSWETSFMMPHSKSTQPLLQDGEQILEGAGSIDKLLSADEDDHNPTTLLPNTNTPVTLNTSIGNSTPPKINPLHHHHHQQPPASSNNNLRTGISLDAAALAKHQMSMRPEGMAIASVTNIPKKYTNTSTMLMTPPAEKKPTVNCTSNGIIANGPSKVNSSSSSSTGLPVSNKFVNESEISC